MKWLNRLAALLFGLISVGIIRDFLDKHTVVVFDKDEEDEEVDDIVNLRPDNYDNAMDLRELHHMFVLADAIYLM